MTKKNVLVIGSNAAGLQAARDLADAGLSVDLIESGPFLMGEGEGHPLDFLQNHEQLRLIKDPDIKVRTNTRLLDIRQERGGFHVELSKTPRFIDLERCTACGDCVDVCPVTIPETGLRAIHFGGQPACAVIEKSGISPCSDACPAGIHVQGYVALINQGQFQQAYQLILDDLPFPSVCGRVCNHVCETACTRSQLDEAVNLMALKRFVADWTFGHQHDLAPTNPSRPPAGDGRVDTGKKVAVIGAGPAGLTAARDLVRLGYKVKVFDNNPEPGGMMRVGIPPHRLNYDQLDWEIGQILEEGIELQLNTWIEDIPGLFDQGFDAVLAAAGASRAIKPELENTDHQDNWLSLDFLKRVSLGEEIDLIGREVIVLGGGDVAMDAARAALRLGPDKVKIVCRGLRASAHELDAVEMEGIEVLRGRVFQRVDLAGKKIAGVECMEAEVGQVIAGKRQFKVIPDSAHLISGDLVIWALGQKTDCSFLPADPALFQEGGHVIQTDDRGRTSLDGLFAAGDFRLGATSFVVDAVGEGHQAADSIHRYLMDLPDGPGQAERDVVLLSPEEIQGRLEGRKKARAERRKIPLLPIEQRVSNFQEVDLALDEKDVLLESSRCLICGPCSECMACVEVCEPKAIWHEQEITRITLHSQAVIAPVGFNPEHGLPGVITCSGEDAIWGSTAAYDVIADHQPAVPEAIPAPQTSGRNGVQVGLVVCQCAGQISDFIHTEELCRNALSWPEIDYASELRVSCSPEGGKELRRIIRDNGLGKLILAACSCCSLDQVCYSCTYQRTRCKENLGVFSALGSLTQIEFVNIREQSAWIHRKNRKKAMESAVDLIRSALGRIPANKQIISPAWGRQYQAMVLGSGDSGRVCIDSLARLGIEGSQIESLTGPVLRIGGKYQLESGGLRADALILAPGSTAELQHIQGSILLPNQQTILSDWSDPQGSPAQGLFICPPDVEAAASGKGTSARAAAWINRTFNQENPRSAVVDRHRCRSCGTCQEACGFGIPELIQDEAGSYASINPYLCQDCGLCTASCPSGAIQPGADQVEELDRVLEYVLS